MNDERHPDSMVPSPPDRAGEQPGPRIVLPHGEPIGGAWTALGLVVIAIGLMLLADRTHAWGFQINIPVWPWFLILMGISRLSYRQADAYGVPRISRSGVWFIIIGSWGLINEYRLFGLHYEHSWPLLIVGAGSMMVWRAVAPVSHARCESRKSIQS